MGTNTEHWGLMFHTAPPPCGIVTGVLVDARTDEDEPKDSPLTMVLTGNQRFQPGLKTMIVPDSNDQWVKDREITQIYQAGSSDEMDGLYTRARQAQITGPPPEYNCVDFAKAAVDAMINIEIRQSSRTPAKPPLSAAAAGVATFEGMYNQFSAGIRTLTECNFDPKRDCTQEDKAAAAGGMPPTWYRVAATAAQ